MPKSGLMELLRSDAPNYSARAGAITVGGIALVLIIAVTGWVPFIGGSSGRVVKAEFKAANQVNKLTPVRVAGVEVGKVESVEPGSAQGTATVTMRITNDDVALHDDARAEVRWRTVLGGNMFIDLEPGSPSAPKLGGTIPASRTSSQSELDDLTQIYDHGTDERQRAMLRGLRAALSDPAGIGHTLETAGPAPPTRAAASMRCAGARATTCAASSPRRRRRSVDSGTTPSSCRRSSTAPTARSPSPMRAAARSAS
jgi:hypothetical protein